MLHHYRRALAFRTAHPTLRMGAMEGLRAEGDLARFLRVGDETIFCAFNLGDGHMTTSLPDGEWQAMGEDLGAVAAQNGQVMLGAWDFCLMKKQ
jgi:alpha-glucosidase